MKKILLLSLLAITSLQAYSQITYEKGYITNRSNQTSTAYIKFNELADNPVKIQYKLTPEGEVQTAGVESLNEFGIGETHKYSRATVNIDRSSENHGDLSTTRNPEFTREVLFLRSLLEGEISLPLYKDDNLTRFFVRTPDEKVEQLIYKKYSTGDNIVRTNHRYRQQLLNLLVCENISENDLETLRYSKRDLLNLFQKYYSCRNGNYKIFCSKKEGELNIMVKAGVNFTTFGMEQDIYDIVDDFQYQVDPRIGVEVEYIFPMANRKIAFYGEPSFSMYNADKEIIIATNEPTPSNPNAPGGYRALVNMDYKILDLPVGLRYYMFLDKANTLKMFINAGASLNLVFNSSTILNKPENTTSEFDFNQSRKPTFFGGVGYRYNEKISVEVRYFAVRPLTDNGGYKLHQNHSFALVAGYTLF